MSIYLDKKQIKLFQKKIFSWYKTNKRDLPWRQTNDPYKILVSEIMSQQTQISRVIPKYNEWIKRFPDVQSLANAKTAEVLTLWSGLGYNRRALYLHNTAKLIIKNYASFPQDIHILQTLPGIGKYTASAILCFAFNAELPVVDTNVRKVILTQFLKQKTASEKQIVEIAWQLLPNGKARQWNQALMDYAAIMLKKEKIIIPKQSTFKISRRYYRGQILKLLVKKKKIRVKELSNLFKHSPYTKEEIIEELCKDQLIKQVGAEFILP